MNKLNKDNGVGVNLMWGNSSYSDKQILSYQDRSSITEFMELSGKNQIKVIADLSTKTYEVLINDKVAKSDIPFSSNTLLNSLRIFANGLDSESFEGRSFDNILIKSKSGVNQKSAAAEINLASINPQVYLFEDFNRIENLTVDNKWEEIEDVDNYISIVDNKLKFNTSEENEILPLIQKSFQRVVTGKFYWSFDFDWANLGEETDYELYMQLGDSLSMTRLDRDAGVAVNLAWRYQNRRHESLVSRKGGRNTFLTNINGVNNIVVEVDINKSTYNVTVNGEIVKEDLPFDKNASIDAVRFFSTNMNNENFAGKSFDNILIESK